MTRPGIRRAAAPVALAALLGACGGGGDDAATSTTRPPSTTAAPTTAPSPAGDLAPLTGVPLADAARRGRPALIVKLDNAPKARPQAGINQADVVVVEKVEDGVTRLAAVFHSQDADPLGPVRSARSTDVAIAASLNRPLFAYSGANAKFLELVRSSPLTDVGFDNFPGSYRRQPGRPAPYNLFSTTAKLYEHAPPDGDPPAAMFRYRAPGTPLQAAGAAPARTAHVEYLGDNIDTIVDYEWTGSGWKRTQDRTPFVDASGAQVAPPNVVIQLVSYKDTGFRDRSGTVVPEAELVGNGDALVLTDGKVVKARWAKADASAVTAFTDSAGAPIALTPGQTWLELAPAGQARVA